MDSKKLLDIIKDDKSFEFYEWLKDGGDRNSMIYRKSLIEHALFHEAFGCVTFLLLWGVDCTSLKENAGLFKILESDETFSRMLREIEGKVPRSSNTNIQYMIDELSRSILGTFPLSHRDTFSFENNGVNTLYCGLHNFEYANWDFLMESVSEALQCDKTTPGKFAMVVSAITRGEAEDEERFSERITGFLVLREAPYHELSRLLAEVESNKDELLIGVHSSEAESALWNDNVGYDVGKRFLESMKAVIMNSKMKVTFKANHSFEDISSWSHDLYRWSMNFKAINGVYPNILLASGITYSRIDMVANSNGQQKIKNPEGENPDGFVAMSGFSTPDFTLEFCIDDRLEANQVKLIFDHGPGGGGEPVDGYEDHLDAVAG